MINIKTAFLVAVLAVLAGCTSTPPRAPAIRLYAMNCGEAHFNDVGRFADDHSLDGQSADSIVPCYLIRHPRGDLIWDTGLPEALADIKGGIAPPGFPARFSVPVRLSAQLAQLGLTPADIQYVSLSHGHRDHAGNLNLFVRSTWIVDADERAFMFSPAARADTQAFSAYSQMENARTVLIEGDGDYDVFGDGTVTIVQAPGHTPGHTILRVNLVHAGTVLLTGDLYNLAVSRERRLVPIDNNRAQTLASMDKVEALAAKTHARVIRQHVIEDFTALPAFPKALD